MLPDAIALYRSVLFADNITYVLSPELQIVRVNEAWTTFARANGGADMLTHWGRGSAILDAIKGDLREPLRALFADVVSSGEREEQDYECSSAETERLFRMSVFPAAARFLVVTHSLRVERPHDRMAMPPHDPAYTHDGIIRMCSNCRRVRAVEGLERWDWVPVYVSAMPDNVTHGLCPPCFEVFAAHV